MSETADPSDQEPLERPWSGISFFSNVTLPLSGKNDQEGRESRGFFPQTPQEGRTSYVTSCSGLNSVDPFRVDPGPLDVLLFGNKFCKGSRGEISVE